MIVIRSFKDNAWYLAGITTATKWENCIKWLKYYFSDINKVREEILAGKIINIPYAIFQRDRRKKDILVRKDRRVHFNISK